MSFTSVSLLVTILLLIGLTSVSTKAEIHNLSEEGGARESHCSEVLRQIDALLRQYYAATVSKARWDYFDEPFILSRRRFTRPTG